MSPEVPLQAGQAVDWRAIVAGTVVASGVSLTLLAFGSAIGLSVASSAPTWRNSSPWLWILSGVFLLFVALSSFGTGGFVAGRMQALTRLTTAQENEFRDGMHGVITWGLTVSLTALLAIGGSSSISREANSSTGQFGLGGSETRDGVVSAELDELLHENRNNDTSDDANLAYHRAEAVRILLKSSSRKGVSNDDRGRLAEIARNQTGISISVAEERVNRAIVESRQEIHLAREAAVMQAFLIAVALMVGSVAAWQFAVEGGREIGQRYIRGSHSLR